MPSLISWYVQGSLQKCPFFSHEIDGDKDAMTVWHKALTFCGVLSADSLDPEKHVTSFPFFPVQFSATIDKYHSNFNHPLISYLVHFLQRA